MWRIGRAPNNTSKWQMGFNLGFKGLKIGPLTTFHNPMKSMRNSSRSSEVVFVIQGVLSFDA
jgi:hypothetical protein